MERGTFERAFAAGETFALLVRRNVIARLSISEQLNGGARRRRRFEVALGSRSSRRFVLTQVEGRAAVLPSRILVQRAGESTDLLAALHAYVLGRIYAGEQLVGCASAHNLTQRAARWVATVADKVGRSDFVLSQEYLAMMLAIETRAVRGALAELANSGALRYDSAERLTILRPEVLREAVCECYEALDACGDTSPDDQV